MMFTVDSSRTRVGSVARADAATSRWVSVPATTFVLHVKPIGASGPPKPAQVTVSGDLGSLDVKLRFFDGRQYEYQVRKSGAGVYEKNRLVTADDAAMNEARLQVFGILKRVPPQIAGQVGGNLALLAREAQSHLAELNDHSQAWGPSNVRTRIAKPEGQPLPALPKGNVYIPEGSYRGTDGRKWVNYVAVKERHVVIDPAHVPSLPAGYRYVFEGQVGGAQPPRYQFRLQPPG